MEPEDGGRPGGRSGMLPVDLIERPNGSRPGAWRGWGTRPADRATRGAPFYQSDARATQPAGARPAEELQWCRRGRMSRFADWRPFASLRTRPPGEKRFLILVPLTGVATGFASVALIRLLGLVQQVLWGSRHELLQHALLLPAWQRFAIPPFGGALVGLIILVSC